MAAPGVSDVSLGSVSGGMVVEKRPLIFSKTGLDTSIFSHNTNPRTDQTLLLISSLPNPPGIAEIFLKAPMSSFSNAFSTSRCLLSSQERPLGVASFSSRERNTSDIVGGTLETTCLGNLTRRCRMHVADLVRGRTLNSLSLSYSSTLSLLLTLYSSTAQLIPYPNYLQ